MPQLSTSHVFISYSRRDTDAMQRIVSHLRGQGLKAWVDNERLVPGTPIWEEEIEKAIKTAYAIVVILSPDAKGSEWVRREITLADQFRKRVFPVLVAGDEDDSIPLRLITRQFVDIRKNESTGLRSLSAAISFYREELEAQEKLALEEAERLARVKEAERLAAEKAEAERIAREKAEEKRIADAKREAERIAKEKRIAEEKATADKKAREAAERLAAQKVEEERLAKAKLETEQLAEEKRRADSKAKEEKKAKEEAERLAVQKAREERRAKEFAEAKQKAEVSSVRRLPEKESTQPKYSPTPLPGMQLQQPMVKWIVIGVIGLCMFGAGIWGISSLAKLLSPSPTPTEGSATEVTTAGLPGTTREPTIEPSVTPDVSFSGKSLVAQNCDHGGFIKSIEATDRYTVVFNLCKPDSAFLSKIAFNVFAIYPEEWLQSTTGSGARTSEGLERPIGTGAYKVSAWIRGDSLAFTANPEYWGEPPNAANLIFRWQNDSDARLLEIQSGAVDGIDDVAATDATIVISDSNLSLLTNPTLNTFYIGMTNTFAPFDDQRVRQAIAMGIDRERIVENFMPFGYEVASHFTPCEIQNGCAGEDWHPFDPDAALALLAEAGYPDGFTINLYYRDVVRSYLPEPEVVAQDIQDQLRNNLGINIDLVVMDSGAFFEAVLNGRADGLYLLGWGGSYPHISDFLDINFNETILQFGAQSSSYTEPIALASQNADPAKTAQLYTEANNAIRDYIPMIPVAHSRSLLAYRADVRNQQTSPFAHENFALVNPGGRDTFIWMQNGEPSSLFCADETDNASLRACAQVMESLYSYQGADVKPALAESCEPNADMTTWVCNLRQGVVFHDGTTFDANDVVTTFTMGLDASSPLHVGSNNTWDYYGFLWGLINQP